MRVLLERGPRGCFMLGRFLCSPGRHGETCVNEVDKRCSSIVGQLDIDEERRDRSTEAQTLVVFLFEVLLTSFFLKKKLRGISLTSWTRMAKQRAP